MTKDTRTNHFSETVRAILSIIEQKEISIVRNSERIAHTGVSFAKSLGLPKQEVDKIYLAALLHDVGMINIPSEILQKTEKLTDGEMAMIRLHPMIGDKILSNLTFLKGILPIVHHHHEFFNGTGYPDGLKGDAIPLGARIMCLLDSYDAMTSGRPYKEPLNKEKVLEELNKSSGEQFDTTLIKAFVNFISISDAPAEVSPSVKKDKSKKEEGTVRDVINNIIQKFKEGKIQLPVLPTVVQDIQKAIRNPISTADNIAELIEKDAVISLRLISISNSAMYRGTDKIQTVRQAVPRLGIKKTQSVVTAIANKNLYNVEDEKLRTVMEQFWLHSLATAFTTKSLAEKLGFKDGENFFLMGLSYDIGKVLLFKPLTEMILKKEVLDMDDVLVNIQEVHAEFGSALLQRWGFSQDIVRTARMHDAQQFSEATQKEILIVNLSNIITRRIGYSLFNDENIDLAETESAKLLKTDGGLLESICEEVKKNMQESKNIF